MHRHRWKRSIQLRHSVLQAGSLWHRRGHGTGPLDTNVSSSSSKNTNYFAPVVRSVSFLNRTHLFSYVPCPGLDGQETKDTAKGWKMRLKLIGALVNGRLCHFFTIGSNWESGELSSSRPQLGLVPYPICLV